MMRLVFALLMGAVTNTACATLSYDHDPIMHTPLADTRWAEPTGATKDEPDGTMTLVSGIRQQMVSAALEIESTGAEKDDYGVSDLSEILKKTDTPPQWTAADGLFALTDLAKKKRAYLTDGEPELGDIILFHNQLDINANGENDDWLTGAGVVVDARGGRCEAVTRTGHAPRRVSAWPERPSLRTHNGSIVNSFVRIPQRTDPPDTSYLAGQLYAGHIDSEMLLAP